MLVKSSPPWVSKKTSHPAYQPVQFYREDHKGQVQHGVINGGDGQGAGLADDHGDTVLGDGQGGGPHDGQMQGNQEDEKSGVKMTLL